MTVHVSVEFAMPIKAVMLEPAGGHPLSSSDEAGRANVPLGCRFGGRDISVI